MLEQRHDDCRPDFHVVNFVHRVMPKTPAYCICSSILVESLGRCNRGQIEDASIMHRTPVMEVKSKDVSGRVPGTTAQNYALSHCLFRKHCPACAGSGMLAAEGFDRIGTLSNSLL